MRHRMHVGMVFGHTQRECFVVLAAVDWTKFREATNIRTRRMPTFEVWKCTRLRHAALRFHDDAGAR